jgi:hypothetical protein
LLSNILTRKGMFPARYFFTQPFNQSSLMYRDLTAKRRELAELKEETKGLKSQIRTRKQNVATLESMLMAAKSSSKRSHKQREADIPVAVTQPSDSQVPAQVRPPIIQFFVTGTSSGVCVECNERGTALIGDVVRSIKHTFASVYLNTLPAVQVPTTSKRRSSSGHQQAAKPTVDDVCAQLMYQGKMLRADTTVDDNNIRVGDTVVCVLSLQPNAVASAPVHEEEEEVKPAPQV